MNIHRQEKVDYKHVSELFFQLHPRKINLSNLLFESIFWNLKKWTFWFIAILKIRHYNFINSFMISYIIWYDFMISWYHIETSPLMCSANRWTGFCMISTFIMEELIICKSFVNKFLFFYVFVCFKYNHSVINTFASEMLLWE